MGEPEGTRFSTPHVLKDATRAHHEAAERGVVLMAPSLPSYEARRKTPKLLADVAPSDAVDCTDLPHLDDLASGLGCLYVLEGATLGGSILSNHVALASYGPDLGAMWRSLGQCVDAFGERHPDGQLAMVGSARATFDKLGQWLSP